MSAVTRRRVALRPGAWLVWGAVVFFMLILAGVVVINLWSKTLVH